MENDNLAPPHPHKSASQPTGFPTENIALDLLRLNGGTQTRAKLNQEGVEDYAEVMKKRGIAVLPPVTVYRDEAGNCWLADGFHRVAAAQQIAWTEIQAQVHLGSRLDALKYSLQANGMHGVRRTNADKRRSVEIVLTEEVLREQGDSSLAELCGVSNHLVADVRRELEKRGELQVGNSPTSNGSIKRQGRDKKFHPTNKRRKEKSSTEVQPALKTVVLDGEEGQKQGEVANTAPASTTARDVVDSETAASAGTNDEVQPQAGLPTGENQDGENAASSADTSNADAEHLSSTLEVSTGNGVLPVGDTRWDEGVLTAQEVGTRLEVMPNTHTHYSLAEQAAFRDCFLEITRTINRLAETVCIAHFVHGQIALEAARIMGNHISSRASSKN